MTGNTKLKIIGISMVIILLILIFTVLVGGNPEGVIDTFGYGYTP